MLMCPETRQRCQQQCHPADCKRAPVFDDGDFRPGKLALDYDYIDEDGQPQFFPQSGEPHTCWHCGQGYIIRDTGYINACPECDSVLRAYEGFITVEHIRRHVDAEEMRCLLRDCPINRELRRRYPRPALS